LDPDRVIEVAAIGSGCDSDQDREPIRERRKGAPLAPQVTAGVDRNSAKPGGELRLPAKAFDLFDQRTADVLSDVVGIRSGAGKLPRKSVDAVVMTLEQGREGVAISGARSGDETGIWIAADFCHPPLPARPKVTLAWR